MREVSEIWRKNEQPKPESLGCRSGDAITGAAIPARINHSYVSSNFFVSSVSLSNRICMFKPKTERLRNLAEKYPERIQELERIFSDSTNVYIDYANVRPWAEKLGWHV